MSDLSKRLEDELAEFLYTGVAEFSGIENGNFPMARKILALPSLRETIEKAEAYDEEKALYQWSPARRDKN